MTPAARNKLFIYVLVNASIPFWTLYFARNFPLHLKILIAVLSAILLNATLLIAFRSRERKGQAPE